METKLCRKCGETKPYSEFTKTTCTKAGITSNCKVCRNAYSKQRRDFNYEKVRATEKESHMKHRLKQLYGITRDDYNNMLDAQDNCCAICKTHKDTLTRALAVDHCHDTGNVRGLLCNRCNRALGQFEDDIELLKAAVSYMRRTTQ